MGYIYEMIISIIDIGTQSVKHYIFNVSGTDKKLLHYKRYSGANLGEHATLLPETIERNIAILSECMALNEKEGAEKTQMLGTDILRKALNADDFTSRIKNSFGLDIQILTHEEEAKLLYEGFIPLLKDDTVFSATNIGGGSTEVVIGDKNKLIESIKIPFGVKFLRQTFASGSDVDWKKLDEYLSENIHVKNSSSKLFITGVLDFISAVGPSLGINLPSSDIPNHPVQMDMNSYPSLVEIIRKTPVEKLKELYPRDPNFCDNFGIGQSVYLAIAKKIGVKIIIPSNNDLTDGIIFELTK